MISHRNAKGTYFFYFYSRKQFLVVTIGLFSFLEVKAQNSLINFGTTVIGTALAGIRNNLFLTNPDFSYSPYYGTVQMILTLKHKRA